MMRAAATVFACLLALACQAASATAATVEQASSLMDAGKTSELRQLLAGTPGRSVDMPGRAALVVKAIEARSLQSLAAVLDWGVDPNRALPFSAQGETLQITPLVYAINGDAPLSVVRVLVEHGAKADVAAEGMYPLGLALGRGRYDIAEYLLQHGANPRTPNAVARQTPLIDLAVAARKDDPAAIDIAKRLIQLGADVNAQDVQGTTALRFAVLNGNAGLARALIDAGANPNIANKKGDTTLQLARRKRLDDIESMLLAAGAKP